MAGRALGLRRSFRRGRPPAVLPFAASSPILVPVLSPPPNSSNNSEMVMTAGRISARTLVAFTVFLAACSPGEQSDAAASEAATPAETPEIAALRTVAAKYADVSVALAE